MLQFALISALKSVKKACTETVKYFPIGACDHEIVNVAQWGPRRIRATSIVTVHILFSNPTVAHPSFARKALMVLCQARAAEGMP